MSSGSTNECVSDFNNNFITLINMCKRIAPGSVVANNSEMIEKIIVTNPDSIIQLFAQYGLKYKDKIVKGDDSFFLNTNEFSQETGGNANIEMVIDEIKGIWRKFDNTKNGIRNKETIKQYIKVLILIADTYVKRYIEQS